MTPNQIAAWNLRRLRLQAGMSQERLAELVSHFGFSWTVFTVSDAELAVERGPRGRRFTPDELVMLSLIFYVTPSELLLPPGPEEQAPVRVRVGDLDMSREEYLLDVLLRPSGVASRLSTGALDEAAK
ncbi:MAG: helix-turn-helix domain-containing protein [Acidimicrobiia bacterium]